MAEQGRRSILARLVPVWYPEGPGWQLELTQHECKDPSPDRRSAPRRHPGASAGAARRSRHLTAAIHNKFLWPSSDAERSLSTVRHHFSSFADAFLLLACPTPPALSRLSRHLQPGLRARCRGPAGDACGQRPASLIVRRGRQDQQRGISTLMVSMTPVQSAASQRDSWSSREWPVRLQIMPPAPACPAFSTSSTCPASASRYQG
ncbi:hypothetical protein Micbo1qcDRAFT_169602 [Microdochium bolleyi]|uniref:Uncharacterized protein n=1 Tax=Microdochium bolleyi TaxID=196109 RepID=A0A136IK99_9PEZI|nr:hypothetical protein Micbo1qcDRAFT_169602 [Microdochium bolleyi]